MPLLSDTLPCVSLYQLGRGTEGVRYHLVESRSVTADSAITSGACPALRGHTAKHPVMHTTWRAEDGCRCMVVGRHTCMEGG